jgi:hypothetical protein
VLIKPTIRGGRRERLLAAARAGQDLGDINTTPDAFDERGLPVAHLARVIEYDVPDRGGNGSGELPDLVYQEIWAYLIVHHAIRYAKISW